MVSPELLHLKAVIEGQRNLPGWRDWFVQHTPALEHFLSRGQLLRLKHYPMTEIPKILRDHGIDFIPSDFYEWIDSNSKSGRCRNCGEVTQCTRVVDYWTWCPNGCFRLKAHCPPSTDEALLPTVDDFDPTGRDPDARWAWVNFGGLTISEAKTKLRERSDIYPEAFGAMGGKAFAFYFPAVEAHLRDVPIENEDDDDYGAWSLARYIKPHFEKSASCMLHLAPQVIALSQYIRQNIGRFGNDADERRRIDDAWVELETHVQSMKKGVA